MTTVCTQEDDFTRERWLSDVRWTAKLSNGESVIQDDGRPGWNGPSAWIRLGRYVRENDLRVESMCISFRSEPPIRLPDHAEGYFFRSSLGALLNSDLQFAFFLVGYLQEGKILVQRYKVPELLLVDTEIREPDDAETVGPSLIRGR